MITNKEITLASFVLQGEDNVVSDMDGEKVMLSVHNGKYYNLGEIGGRIWDLMGAPAAVHQIVSVLLTEYTVDRSECEQHVLSFLGQLAEEELIHIGETGKLA
jgi:hypothetical protein